MKKSIWITVMLVSVALLALVSSIGAIASPPPSNAYLLDTFNSVSQTWNVTAPSGFVGRWLNTSNTFFANGILKTNTTETVTSRISVFQGSLALVAKVNGTLGPETNLFGFGDGAMNFIGFSATPSNTYAYVIKTGGGVVIDSPFVTVDSDFHLFTITWQYGIIAGTYVQTVQFSFDNIAYPTQTIPTLFTSTVPIQIFGQTGMNLYVDWVAYNQLGSVYGTTTSIVPTSILSTQIITQTKNLTISTVNAIVTSTMTVSTITLIAYPSYTGTTYGIFTSYYGTITNYGWGTTTIATTTISVLGQSTETQYTGAVVVTQQYVQTVNEYQTQYNGYTTVYNTVTYPTTVTQTSTSTSLNTNATSYVTYLQPTTVIAGTINQTITIPVTKMAPVGNMTENDASLLAASIIALVSLGVVWKLAAKKWPEKFRKKGAVTVPIGTESSLQAKLDGTEPTSTDETVKDSRRTRRKRTKNVPEVAPVPIVPLGKDGKPLSGEELKKHEERAKRLKENQPDFVGVGNLFRDEIMKEESNLP